MSDADNQMGGSGGDTGRKPEPGSGAGEGGNREAAGGSRPQGVAGGDDEVDAESEESFPASDPPANY